MNYLMAIFGGLFALIIIYDLVTHGDLVTRSLDQAQQLILGETKLLEAR